MKYFVLSNSALSTRYLLVVEVVNEAGEAPGLVLHSHSQHWHIANEYGVKVSHHFEIVTVTQRLEKH